MMKKNSLITIMIALLLLVLTACVPVGNSLGSSNQSPSTIVQATQAHTALREAQVESVEVRFSKTEPVQAWAIVRGHLSESCAALTDPQTSYAANLFKIKVQALSPTDQGCIQLTTPFEQSVALDTASLTSGTYTVIANGVSTSFNFPTETVQPAASLRLVVRANDGTLQVANLDLPLNVTARPTFNSFLPYGGGAEGAAYVLDSNQAKAFVTTGNGFQDLIFVQAPTPYGLAVWAGGGNSPSRLAWATQDAGNHSSTIKISSLDGKFFDTLLTQDSPNPPSQLVAQFFSADGRWLYFSKEPVGLGGYILFGGGSNLYKIDVSTKQVVEVIAPASSSAPQACLDAISADFRYVADHCSKDVITVRDLVNGSSGDVQPPVEASGYRFMGSARFSPSGNHLAFALAKGEQDNEQGWVALTGLNGGSSVILTSPAGRYYTVAGWLDDQTILVQSTNPLDCSPTCNSELWTVKVDGTEAKKVSDGSFLAMLPNDAIIQLPAGPASTPATAGCTDAAKYLSDDGKDGTTYAPNTAFTKTWKVENTGTCTWDSTYMVYQISGPYMTQQPGYWIVPQGQTVKPGDSVDISIGMTSPVENGSYESYWGLKNTAGEGMPIQGGANGNSFYVILKVNNGKASGVVTATSIDIEPEQGSGNACTSNTTYFVHAHITTDGPVTADYEIGSTAGQIPAGNFEQNGGLTPYVTGRLIFEQADTKSIDVRFVGPYPHPDDITVFVRVNGGEFVSAKLSCPQ